MKTAVIGVGSPFGCDQLGANAIEGIREDVRFRPLRERVELHYYDRPGLLLMEYMRGFDAVILIDAISCAGKDNNLRAGVLHRLRVDDLAAANVLSSHDVGVAECLQLARALDRLPSKLLILAMSVQPEQTVVDFQTIRCLLDAVFDEIDGL